MKIGRKPSENEEKMLFIRGSHHRRKLAYPWTLSGSGEWVRGFVTNSVSFGSDFVIYMENI